MRHLPTAAPSTRRVLVVVLSLLLLLFGGFGAHAAMSDRNSMPGVVPVSDERGPGPDEDAPTGGAHDLPASLPRTDDPEAFSRAVAHALFDWDTSRNLEEYAGPLLAVADPTGEESPGLVADVANYLPALSAWLTLRPYSTRQWIEIDSVEVPSTWESDVAAARSNRFLPGTTAVTIKGTRHRDGTWEEETVATAHEVAFTVFVVCRPSYQRCHLLRLSRLDEPLD